MIDSLQSTLFKKYVAVKNRTQEIRTPDRDSVAVYARDNTLRAKRPDGDVESISAIHTSVDSANSTAYTTKQVDEFVGVDTNDAAVTVTLDSASASRAGTKVIKDEGGNAGTNSITVDTEGSETIDGSSSTSIATNDGVLRLYSDGANWYTY